MNLENNSNEVNLEENRKKYYPRLFRKFIFLTVLCSLVPLLIVGWGINFHYTSLSKERVMTLLKTYVEHHRKIIELFLSEHSSKLQLIAHSHSIEYLRQVPNLNEIFEIINKDNWSVTDIGLIDDSGAHIAYVGPYDLMKKNYSKTLWFKEVMSKGLYISDMFTGFRNEPHFIIAVTRTENNKKWILRATINPEVFRSLVENVSIGKTGEVYLLNKDGIFQTTPRFHGKIMEKASFPIEPIHEGIRVRVIEKDSYNPSNSRQIVCETWLDTPKWLLVVKQSYKEAFYAVNHANYATLIFLHVSAITILIVAIFITKHMITVIQNRDKEADQLNKQLMQAGKLASIGELSAGVAHEINTPLAIILTERQLMIDCASIHPISDPDFLEQFNDSMNQIDVQIHRCKRITQNLLRFSRRTKSVLETIDINHFIREVIELMEREARTNGIKFFAELDNKILSVVSDPSQLQQVFLNIITNAIDAHDEKPYGSIRIKTEEDKIREGVIMLFTDTGSGIPQELIDKIFDPFFTTKPVGKGTGLGLSICYSTMKNLGGSISVSSELGKGTTITLFIPYKPPKELAKDMAASN
ncbi:MAG: two-component sensor histidine kinase [Desulfobacterales bacterium]|nr:two-component sensor histidine kinase [Desulfobacterales bacterium]MBF0397379.1 two-component sensor histidine kinase [Desulfobacterales bacterium]